MMSYKCGLCGMDVGEDLRKLVKHTETHIVDEIKKKHPDWAERNGVCPKCLDYYKQQMKGDR